MNNIKNNQFTAEHDDELLECFDNNGKTISPETRQNVHGLPLSIWHGVASVWLINSKGDILCSKRSELLSGNPGKWQTYFGGHIKVGSNFLKTAQEELEEEIGLTLHPESLILVESGKREDVMHLYHLYAVLFNGKPSTLNFSDGEIVEAKWYSFHEYEQQKNTNPTQWCNSIKLDQYNKTISGLGLKLG